MRQYEYLVRKSEQCLAKAQKYSYENDLVTFWRNVAADYKKRALSLDIAAAEIEVDQDNGIPLPYHCNGTWILSRDLYEDYYGVKLPEPKIEDERREYYREENAILQKEVSLPIPF